jgi:hypothetical protein
MLYNSGRAAVRNRNNANRVSDWEEFGMNGSDYRDINGLWMGRFDFVGNQRYVELTRHPQRSSIVD